MQCYARWVRPEVLVGVVDDVLIPEVGVELEIRLCTGERVAKSMMEKDMLHPLMPAADTVMRIESCFTEAAPVRGRRVDMAEMGQTMENPFFIVGIRETPETVQEIEGAFQNSRPPRRTDDQSASLILAEASAMVQMPRTHG
ncbi:MAG: hypothetical protein Q9205_000933 [Flavoplaca limonia]